MSTTDTEHDELEAGAIPPDELEADESGRDAADLSQIEFEDGVSVLDRIRRRREEREEEVSTRKFAEMTIPGWERLIVARFRYVPVKELRKKTRAAARAAKANVSAQTSQAVILSIETLNLACVEVVARTPQGLKPFDPAANPPIRFDSRLLRLIGLPEGRGSYHEAILSLFGSEYAILNAAAELTRWFEDRSYEIDEDVLGE